MMAAVLRDALAAGALAALAILAGWHAPALLLGLGLVVLLWWPVLAGW
jgi:hypothetical protein